MSIQSFRTRFNNIPSIGECLLAERQLIYQMLFYAAGMLLGSFTLKALKLDGIIKILQSVFKIQTQDFATQFWANLALYLSVFTIALVLGLCIIGYPVIHAIPACMGIVIGIKITYFFMQHGVKGMGYSLLLLLPESAAIVTVMMFTVSTSAKLSQYIIQSAAKKETFEKPNAVYLLKKYLVYLLFVLLIAFINALLSFLLAPIIKI